MKIFLLLCFVVIVVSSLPDAKRNSIGDLQIENEDNSKAIYNSDVDTGDYISAGIVDKNQNLLDIAKEIVKLLVENSSCSKKFGNFKMF